MEWRELHVLAAYVETLSMHEHHPQFWWVGGGMPMRTEEDGRGDWMVNFQPFAHLTKNNYFCSFFKLVLFVGASAWGFSLSTVRYFI